MAEHPPPPGRFATARWHVALLLLLCVCCYFPGLDSHGVTNWQEGQRLLVARDMQARGDWVVPTVHGQAYIAKPPMIYWAQMAVAGALGDTVELWHLRFVVALAGLLGVLATYGAARELLTPDRATSAEREFASRAAMWSASLLATGILYVRASRIGELDILIVPFVTVAVWAVARAFRTHRMERRTNWSAVLTATIAAIGAVLTKDTAIGYIATAAYCGMMVWYAYTRDPLDQPRFPRALRMFVPPASAFPSWLPIAWGAILGFIFFLTAMIGIDSVSDIPGPVLAGIAGTWIGVTFARCLQPPRCCPLFAAMSRIHPLIVISLSAAVAIGWRWLVAQRIGPDLVANLATGEVDDNVRMFVSEAPIKNLETMLFGLGLGSALAIVACGVLLRWRPRLTPGGAIIAAWILVNLIIFSLFGKGVQRYLTPMWPAWAMLAGWMAATWCRPRPMKVSPGPWLAAAVVLLGVAQSFQYGWLRDRLNAKRSPRDLIAAVSRLEKWQGPDRLFSYEYASPAFDYYAGHQVSIVGDPRALATMYAGDAWPLERFKAHVVAVGEVLVIHRDGRIPGVDLPPALERLRAAGFVVEELRDLPSFEIDNGRTPMKAAVVSMTPPASKR